MAAEEIRRLADQARELKDDPAFTAAVLALRKQWFGELMLASAPERMTYLTHRLQTLEAIPQQLQSFMNDHEMAKRRSK